MRNITCVVLEMTTVCDRACINCCAGINMGLRAAIHHPWEYFVEAALHLRGIERLHLTGGEPTTHPYFAEFVPRFRELFDCKTMTLQTNGFKAREFAEALKHFDHIYPSYYDAKNAGAVEFIQLGYPSTTWPHGEAGFTPRSRRGSGQPCERGFSDTVSYADGNLFGCCVGAGVTEAVGMKPTPEWKREIQSLPLPCSTCWFSPGAAA